MAEIIPQLHWDGYECGFGVTRVRWYRTQRKMLQRELAERVGVSRYEINRVERGMMAPTPAVAVEIAAVFDCPFSDLWEIISTAADLAAERKI